MTIYILHSILICMCVHMLSISSTIVNYANPLSEYTRVYSLIPLMRYIPLTPNFISDYKIGKRTVGRAVS